MKSIFPKFFGNFHAGALNARAPLPSPLSGDNIHDHQRRALIGWIANRMSQHLNRGKGESGFLIYLSFTAAENEPQPKNDEGRYLLSLAARLVEMVEKQEDVYLKIKEMHLSDRHHRCFLKTYEEIKQDLTQYIPSAPTIEPVGHPEEDEVWQVYRDVMYAITQRKFLLIRKHEVEPYKAGKLLCTAPVIERSDIPKARELAKQSLIGIGIPQTAIMSHLLVISEAITNILKHAREGKMTMFITDAAIHLLVEDQGPGFPLKHLPNAALMAGYSTKKSLGQGFTLMMKMTERVLLSTIPGEGSSLILIFNR